jgi:phosphoglycolate phosphatase-like HAD superfamily hydrolase
MRVVLFDIDGTLANIDHRRSILEDDPHNWIDFFAAMGGDSPNKAVVDLYHLLWTSTEHECVIVSGRPDNYRKITEQWFVWNNIPFSRLIMRSQNDSRADHIIKEEILKALLEEGKEIAFVVDDRQSVVDMWRRNGLTCFQCDDYYE